VSVGTSFVDLALRCYPQWWTERYGEEMRAVVDDLKLEGRSENAIAFGLLRDALRSRFQARGMPRTYGLLATRTRTSVATGTLPWLAIIPFVMFVTSGLVVRSTSGAVQVGYPFQLTGFRTRVVSEPGVHWVHPLISTTTWIVGASTMALDVLYLLTLLVLTVGLGALRYGIAREKKSNRRSMYLLTWLPVATLVIFVGLRIVQPIVGDNSHPFRNAAGQLVTIGGHTAVAAFLGDLSNVVAIVGWIFTMLGLAFVANRANVPPDTLRFGRTVSVFTSISLSLTFVAVIVWGIGIDVQRRQPQIAGAITATYQRHDWWLALAFGLALACAASLWGATTARRSWRIIAAQRLWDA
jgi:hypothetical protein